MIIAKLLNPRNGNFYHRFFAIPTHKRLGDKGVETWKTHIKGCRAARKAFRFRCNNIFNAAK